VPWRCGAVWTVPCRQTLLAANAIYAELYGEQGEEGAVLPASFQVSRAPHSHRLAPGLLLDRLEARPLPAKGSSTSEIRCGFSFWDGCSLVINVLLHFRSA
jgi:hypothetical protein